TLGTATTGDNCPGAVTVERLVGATVISAPYTFPVGMTTVTYRATDAAGNTQTSTQVVTVQDTTAPVISCPANIFTPPGPGGSSASVGFNVTATDNCGGATVVNMIGTTVITSPHTFPVGTTTVTSTATDTAGNTSSCMFTVTVGSGTVTTVSPVTGQYSDSVNLQATVTPIVAIPGSPLTGSVQFFVNGTSVGTAPVPAGGGLVSLPYLLTQAAGASNITAQFTSSNPNYLNSSDGPATLTVEKELTATAYTGDESILTAGPGVTTATVRLAAHLTQEADGAPGDITLARVRFYLFKSTNMSSTPDLIVPALASPGLTPDSNGDVLTTVNLAADTWMVKVKVDPANQYWKHSNVAIGVVNITVPTNEQRSNGGGWVPDAASADGKAHFGFTVSLGGGKNPALKGNSTFFFHGLDGFDYLVKGNSWQGGYLQFSAEPGVTPLVYTRSNFKGRCNVQKIDPATGEVVQSWGNFTFEVFTKDGDLLTPKQPDAYSITIWDGNVVFHQVGSRTSLVTLGGGNITNKNK
ncbi:MAG TPA: HYR domain-containing protein, partial [Pyrinomonadaceae bacterium]